MPNWCMNNVDIVGPTDKVYEFKNTILNEDNEAKDILEILCPLGEWDYDKAIKEWGTKWDVEGFIPLDVDYEDTGRSFIRLTFDSAWGPPVEAFETGSTMFPELKFGMTWWEPGMAFYGGIIIKDGNCVNDVNDNTPNFHPDDLNWDDPDALDRAHDNEMAWWGSWVDNRKFLLGS